MEYDEAAVSYSESNKHKVGYFFGQTSYNNSNIMLQDRVDKIRFLHKTERRTGLKLQQLLYSSESSTFSLFYYPCRYYSFTQQNQLECITDIKS
ncbi:hypothetical protein HZH66_014032 [Vespula vulgaris]|uniref:Uncharacterized protein n=1 Tax=Vespula vulgaris TaxID=7454 RepID=A0A834J4T9_VESVU|nr:hypothetical protein HZH66_014032 [Vespula vulgaris]